MKRQISAARREILLLLRQHGPQTVDALSARVGITPVGVRKHLDTLEIDGLVQSVTERRKIGRPVQVYDLTEAADELFPKAYDATLLSILRQVRRLGGEELLRQVLEGRQQEIEEQCRERLTDAATTEERLQTLVTVRTEAGYMTEWAREGDMLVLKEHNCAVCRASREFPEMCDSEYALFQRMAGEEMEVQPIQRISGGSHFCLYTIRPRVEEPAPETLPEEDAAEPAEAASDGEATVPAEE